MVAVLFDLEGTLVETLYERDSGAVDELRRETKKKIMSLGVPAVVLEDLVTSTLLRNKAFDWVEANMGPAEGVSFHAELDSFMKSFEMRSAKLSRLYPDTLEALEELDSRGVEMGMATNTSWEAADSILRNLGLKGFFKVIVTRNDVPRLKPEPAMVFTAITRMERSVGWFVGNSRFDTEAAVRAGISSIIVRRDGIRPSFSYDYFISSLNDVPSIVFGG